MMTQGVFALALAYGVYIYLEFWAPGAVDGKKAYFGFHLKHQIPHCS